MVFSVDVAWKITVSPKSNTPGNGTTRRQTISVSQVADWSVRGLNLPKCLI